MDKKKDQSHAACQHYGTSMDREPCKSCYKMFSNFAPKGKPGYIKLCRDCIDYDNKCDMKKCMGPNFENEKRELWRPKINDK